MNKAQIFPSKNQVVLIMMNINHKQENRLYKCHFCQENIDVYGIEKHFATFHKFRNSVESEYVCEFCDNFEEFHS